MINEEMFASYKVKFPEEKLKQLFKYYPDIFNKDRLKNELYITYICRSIEIFRSFRIY
jgi:hypothetical protein